MFAFLEVNEDLNKVIVWVGIALIAVVLVALVWKIVSVVLNAKKAKADGEKIQADTQPDVSADELLEEMEQKDEYLVMARHVIYSAGENGQILPGKYELRCAVEDAGSFNVRYNGLVREFDDGDTVVLASGDTVCPVSHSVLIKAVK